MNAEIIAFDFTLHTIATAQILSKHIRVEKQWIISCTSQIMYEFSFIFHRLQDCGHQDLAVIYEIRCFETVEIECDQILIRAGQPHNAHHICSQSQQLFVYKCAEKVGHIRGQAQLWTKRSKR